MGILVLYHRRDSHRRLSDQMQRGSPEGSFLSRSVEDKCVFHGRDVAMLHTKTVLHPLNSELAITFRVRAEDGNFYYSAAECDYSSVCDSSPSSVCAGTRSEKHGT